MAEYRKYMFDDFVVNSRKQKTAEVMPTEEEPKNATKGPFEEEKENEIAETEEMSAKTEPESTSFLEEETLEQDKAPEIIEPSYSKEDIENAAKVAAEEAYEKALVEAQENELAKQNILLEEIKNQLGIIFAKLDEEESVREQNVLKVAVAATRKVLPTLEKEKAETEIKNFLSENFANFAGQEMLSFAFNPESVSLVADSIGRLAEQNDFEGKIAVHKDSSLGVSDCRVEWKNGGVERKAADILDKFENLINNDEQERGNGE